jgi:hypothetical protein
MPDDATRVNGAPKDGVVRAAPAGERNLKALGCAELDAGTVRRNGQGNIACDAYRGRGEFGCVSVARGSHLYRPARGKIRGRRIGSIG